MRPALQVDESLSAAELAKLAGRERDARMRGRIIAVRHLRLGHTVPEASNALGMSERQLRNWVHRYNAEGVTGLRDRPRPGQPPHLAADQVERFKEEWHCRRQLLSCHALMFPRVPIATDRVGVA